MLEDHFQLSVLSSTEAFLSRGPSVFSHLRPTENVVEVTVGSCGCGGIVLARLSGDSRAHLAPGRPSGRTLLPAAAAWSAARGLEVTVTLSPSLCLTPPPRHLTTLLTRTLLFKP